MRKSRNLDQMSCLQMSCLIDVTGSPYPPNQEEVLNKIKAEQAWDHATGRDVIVAVLDTGVKINHPALKNQFL